RNCPQHVRHHFDRELLDRVCLAQIRIDAIGVLTLYAIAFAAYGERWPLLAGCLMTRALLISQLDHAAHRGPPLELRAYPFTLSPPPLLQRWLLGFNLHRTHHQHPNLPWSAPARPSRFERGDMPLVRAVLRQWRRPIELHDIEKLARDFVPP